MLSFFTLIAFPTYNFLDDDMELYKCQTGLEPAPYGFIFLHSITAPLLLRQRQYLTSSIEKFVLHRSAWMLNYG